MKKIIFANEPEQAAIDFVKENEAVRPNDVDMTIIPCSLSNSEKFWAELVKVNPEFIGRVPNTILEGEAFASLVNHNLFYLYLPKKYLTKEDYEFHKENVDYAIRNQSYVQRAVVTRHDEHIWYKFDNSSHWLAASEMTARFIFNQFDELTKASELMPELWTQELADMLWNSSLAIVSFNAIPHEFVRPEWDAIVEIFCEKRYHLFGRGSTWAHPEHLAEYWSNFKTKDELEMAFQVEEFVGRCANAYGYAVNVRIADDECDYSNEFKDLYLTVKSMVEHDSELMESFIKLYGLNFLKHVPVEVMDINWIIMCDQFKYCKREYLGSLKELELSESEVEQLEAQEFVDSCWDMLKKVVNSCKPMSDEEVMKLVDTD